MLRGVIWKTFPYVMVAVFTVGLATLITLASAGLTNIQPEINNSKNSLHYIKNIKATKIILDVDAGVDDAFGILMLLAKDNPDYPELIAITCSHGNTNVRNVGINVLKVLKILQKKIPVYIGAYASLTTTPKGDNFYGEDGFGDVPDNNPPSFEELEKEHAANAMIRLTEQYPGEVAIVVTGPLTNIGLAIRLDPNFKSNLKALYWMGGSVEGIGNIKPGIEFNAFMDPESNYIAYNTSGPPVITFSWEACKFHATVSKSWRQDVLGKMNNTLIQFLNAIEAVSLSKNNVWTPCDAMLMAVLINPALVLKATSLHVDTSYQGDGRGALLVDYKDKIEPRNAVLIQELDAQLFQDMCRQIFS